MAVYLLHSTVPLVRESGREVRHYLGYTCEGGFPERLERHYANHGSAKIVQAFLRVGGELWLGRYWEGLTRDDERRMKTAGHLAGKCLWCEVDRLRHLILEDHGTAGVPLPLGRGHLLRLGASGIPLA